MSEKAWQKAFTSGSKSLQDRLRKVHAKNPAFQSFLGKHGLQAKETSVKQASTAKKVDAATKKERERVSSISAGGSEDGGVSKTFAIKAQGAGAPKVYTDVEKAKYAKEHGLGVSSKEEDPRTAAIRKAVAKVQSKNIQKVSKSFGSVNIPSEAPHSAEINDIVNAHRDIHSIDETWYSQQVKQEQDQQAAQNSVHLAAKHMLRTLKKLPTNSPERKTIAQALQGVVGAIKESEQIEEGKWSDEADKLEGKVKPFSIFANKVEKEKRERIRGKAIENKVTKILQAQHGAENVQRVKEDLDRVVPKEGTPVKVIGNVEHSGRKGKIVSSNKDGSFHVVQIGDNMHSFHGSNIERVKEEVEQIQEMDSADGLPLGKKATPITPEKAKKDSLDILQQAMQKARSKVKVSTNKPVDYTITDAGSGKVEKSGTMTKKDISESSPQADMNKLRKNFQSQHTGKVAVWKNPDLLKAARAKNPKSNPSQLYKQIGRGIEKSGTVNEDAEQIEEKWTAKQQKQYDDEKAAEKKAKTDKAKEYKAHGIKSERYGDEHIITVNGKQAVGGLQRHEVPHYMNQVLKSVLAKKVKQATQQNEVPNYAPHPSVSEETNEYLNNKKLALRESIKNKLASRMGKK